MRGKRTQIDGMTSIGAGDERQRRIGPALFDRHSIEPHFGEPPDEIAAAVAARHALVASYRQVHVPARTREFLRNLSAGRTRTDDQNGTGR